MKQKKSENNNDSLSAPQLSDADLKKLKPILDKFEWSVLTEQFLHRINGGFATADYSYHDKNNIYIKLVFGTQNDVDNDVYEEDWKLPIDDFNDPMTPEQHVRLILPCN